MDNLSEIRTVEFFLERGILLSEELFRKNKTVEKDFLNLQDNIDLSELLVLQPENIDSKSEDEVNWKNLEKLKSQIEMSGSEANYSQIMSGLATTRILNDEKVISNVVLVSSYKDNIRKRGKDDFTQLFIKRYVALEKLLRNRRELQNLTSISRIIGRKEREQVSMVGMVAEIYITKNDNIVLTVEDLTGRIKVLVNKNKPELYASARGIVPDEVIGIVGTANDNIVFSNNILWPDIPLSHELRKSPDEVYAAFISDIHCGSNNFLKDEFIKFTQWLRGDVGNDQQNQIAKKTKYLIIAGDLVDGVGIYPNQDKELLIKDITEQYKELASLLELIPKHISIIICPGNHDAIRLAEPQLPIYSDYAESLYALDNVTFVSNPALINLHKSANFPGFNVLMYHGASFDYYVNNVDELRLCGGYERGDLVMKFLLKRRHLAPTHTSTSYVPDPEIDPLVINTIPDFFVTGHIHYSVAANYRNVTMICCSCWQSMTSFQEKVGHNPQPCRVPVVNLQTREIKILKFIDD